jgi:hypothetical protein
MNIYGKVSEKDTFSFRISSRLSKPTKLSIYILTRVYILII